MQITVKPLSILSEKAIQQALITCHENILRSLVADYRLYLIYEDVLDWFMWAADATIWVDVNSK